MRYAVAIFYRAFMIVQLIVFKHGPYQHNTGFVITQLHGLS